MQIGDIEQSDIDYLKDHSTSRGIFAKLPERCEWVFALRHEGETLMVGGINLLTHTTAWAWADLSDKAHNHMIQVYRIMRDWLELCAAKHGIKRMQAYVMVGFEEGERTIEHLGFHWESNMPNFVDDKPAGLYIRYFNEVK